MKGKKRQRMKRLDFKFNDLPNGVTYKKYISSQKQVSIGFLVTTIWCGTGGRNLRNCVGTKWGEICQNLCYMGM